MRKWWWKLFSKSLNNHESIWKSTIFPFELYITKCAETEEGIKEFCSIVWLNCTNFEWNWVNWESWVPAVDRFPLFLTLRLMAFKAFFISLVSGKSIALVANPTMAKHLTMTIKLNTSMYSMETATKNPEGFFVSNGNLWFNQKEMKFLFDKRNWFGGFYYHAGIGNSKASSLKSVAKYLKKLTINAGNVQAIGVTDKNATSIALIHFSTFCPASVNNAAELEYWSPAFTRRANVNWK